MTAGPTGSHAAAPSQTRSSIAPGALLVGIATLIAYLPSLRNGFVWDDWRMIVANPHFTADWTVGARFYAAHPFFNIYQPLTCAAWAVAAAAGWTPTPSPEAGHLNPALFHLASLLLHAAAAVALFLLLHRIVRLTLAAVLGALLFALHPVQVEAVAFAGAMNNPLMGALSLACLWCYCTWACGPNSRARWWLATLLLVLAILAKPTAVVVPVLAALLDRWVVRRNWRSIVLALWPWCILAGVAAVVTATVQHGQTVPRVPLRDRPGIAADAIAMQSLHVVWPAHLAIDYGRSPDVVIASDALRFSWVPALLLAGVAVALRRRAPLAAAGLGVFLVAQLPNSGLVPFDFQLFSTVADRYVYLSMAGVGMVAAAVAARVPRGLAASAGAIVICLLVWGTELQIRTWRDGPSLFEHAMAVNPRSWMSAANMSEVEPDPRVAIPWARRAIAIRPTTASAWNNLGSLLMQIGDRRAGATALARAAALDPTNPTFAANARRAAASQP